MEFPVYITCAACMSIWSEWLSWANRFPPDGSITKTPENAKTIIVLGCQVTDLAVLNDLMKLEALMKEYPDKKFAVGGCLSKREDIALPEGVARLENMKCDYQPIWDKTLINYELPFWVNEWRDEDSQVTDGHLFRDMYPLRISVGCKGCCEYCTIRKTRGKFYELSPELCVGEFKSFENILLIADSPSESLLSEWIDIAKRYKKPIAIRNVEPAVAIGLRGKILDLADRGLLSVFHCPVQSGNKEAVQAMGRSVEATTKIISFAKFLKSFVVTATNIIIDYRGFPECIGVLEDAFTYISWNPYWDGHWDRKLAEQRWEHYLKE